MKIHRDLDQKSWDWFCARAGKVTGSELKNLITDKLAIRKWSTEMPNSYLDLKVAEKWRGEPLESFSGNRQTDQGILREPQARKFFSSLLESDIEQIGGIESDDGRCWCSPDGIIGETGLEIKCPNADTHVGWLRRGVMPEEHVLQVQFSLWVSGFAQWNFLSFCADFPHLAILVKPDPAAFSLIETAVQQFNEFFDDVFDGLVKLNGGPPPERKRFVPSSTDDPRAALFGGVGYQDDVPH